MTVNVVVPSPTRSIARHPMMRPDVAVANRAFRQVWKGAAICAVAFGATVASSALTYVATFPDEASRRQLLTVTGTESGLEILFGSVSGIDTVGGYTTYKGFIFLTTIGAIWGLLAATRLLRGEEDAGRWQLVLSGVTGSGRATAATLCALGAAVVVMFLGTTILTMAAGSNAEVGFGFVETLLYGVSIVIPPAVFVGVGAVASQLGRTRRMASGLGMAVLGVAFLLRMVADSGPTTKWLLWLTPLGWTELMEPLTENRVLPVVPAGLTVLILGVAATLLASRRDAGAGLVASRDVVALRPYGLRSALGLAVRLDVLVLAAWCAGAAATGLAMGILAKLTAVSLPEGMTSAFEKFGVAGSFSAQYFGVVFLLIATVVALLPAGQLGTISSEEASGRLVHVLAGPTSRAAWFLGRVALSASGIVFAAFVAGLGSWIGAVSQGVEVDFMTLIGAGLNVVPTALVALGFGAVVFAVAPRAASAAVYGLVIWSLLIDLVGSMITSVSWLNRLSLFHYMVLAPAQAPVTSTLTVTVIVALVLVGLATVLFNRRDVQG